MYRSPVSRRELRGPKVKEYTRASINFLDPVNGKLEYAATSSLNSVDIQNVCQDDALERYFQSQQEAREEPPEKPQMCSGVEHLSYPRQIDFNAPQPCLDQKRALCSPAAPIDINTWRKFMKKDRAEQLKW